MRSHLVRQTSKSCQSCAQSAVSVPHKAIGKGTWLLLRQALHVYVIQRDSEDGARNFSLDLTPEHNNIIMSVPLGHSATLLLRVGDTGFGFSRLSWPLLHGPPEQGNYSGPSSTLALSLAKHFNFHRQKQKRFAPLPPLLPVLKYCFYKALRSHVSTNFLVLQFCAAVAKFCQNSSAHPLHLSAPLLIILIFVFSFLLNVLFILFRVSPGTLQNWM